MWAAVNVKEIARLAQGRANKSIEGSNTLFFKHPKIIPLGRKATYLRVVTVYLPTKEDQHRVLWTVGVNRIYYPGATCAPNTDITTAKLLFNSVISTKNANFMEIDLKDFYLNILMESYKYILIPITMMPQDMMNIQTA